MRWVRGAEWCGLAVMVVAVVAGASRAEEVASPEGTDRPAAAELWQSLDTGDRPAEARHPSTSDAAEGRSREAPALRVERIAYDDGAVHLTLSGPAVPVARALRAHDGNGPRIYVDLPGAELGAGVPRTLAGHGPVRRVRAAQFDADTARVVIELAHATPFRVRTQGRIVTVALAATPEEPRARLVSHRGPAARKVAAPAPALLAAALAEPFPPAAPFPPAPAVDAATPVTAAMPVDAATPVELATPVEPVTPVELATPVEPVTPVELATPVDPVTAAGPVTAVTAAPRPDAPAPTEPAAAPRPAVPTPNPLVAVNGVVFAWPDLEAPEYGDAEAEPYRRALKRWRTGVAPTGPTVVEPRDPAAMYLAGDLAALRAAAGLEDTLDALGTYERALRTVPEFPDAARAQLMVGYLNLQLGFAPEASAAFSDLLKRRGTSPLAPYAKLGLATALRLRHRPAEARKALEEILPQAQGDTLCHARLEEARIASATGDAGTAANLFRRLASVCPAVLALPGALADEAEALAAVGALDEARRILAEPRENNAPEESARLELLAGRLAVTAGDAVGAHAAFSRVLRMEGIAALKLEAEMRLAVLDAGSDPARAAAALAPLAEKAAPIALRAAVLGEAADAMARAGNVTEALALLDRAAALGPEGEAQADGRRTELLGHLLERAVESHDAATVATIYAAYTTQVDQLAVAADRLAVADVLRRFGLHDAAARLLGQGPDAGRPALAVARAEALLAAGEASAARSVAARVSTTGLPPDLAVRIRRVVVRAAVAAGDLDGAAAQLVPDGEAELRAEVARAVAGKPDTADQVRGLVEPLLAPDAQVAAAALVTAGDAALAAGLAEQATAAYSRALEHALEGSVRVRAAAGLAQVAVARGDREAARTALGIVGEADPFVRRAVAALDRAGVLETREADAH